MFQSVVRNRLFSLSRRQSSTLFNQRRCFFDDSNTVNVKKAVKPPVLEDVVAVNPAEPLARKARQEFSNLGPLDTPLPNLPASSADVPTEFPTVASLLSNGVRVISQHQIDRGSVVGVVIDGGTSHETDTERGASMIVSERLAFSSPELQKKRAQLQEKGGSVTPFYGREIICFMAEVLPNQIQDGLEMIADHINEPKFSEKDFEAAKQDVLFSIENYRNQPDMFVPEMLHAVAYGAAPPGQPGGLGRPLIPSEKEIKNLTMKSTLDFIKNRYVGANIVVAGAGVSHDTLEPLAMDCFGKLSGDKVETPQFPVYRGGAHSLEASEGSTDETHVAVAFEGASDSSDEIYPAFLLEMLLGGGRSFSTGGPGKGMHSQLFNNVLCRNGNFEACVAFNETYRGTGLFGIYSAASHLAASDVLKVSLDELISVAKGIDRQAFERARNRLKATALMNLESRLVLFEDLARQSLSTGTRKSPATVVKKIDAMTADEVSEFVRNALAKRPTILTFGPSESVKTTPECPDVEEYIRQQLNL